MQDLWRSSIIIIINEASRSLAASSPDRGVQIIRLHVSYLIYCPRLTKFRTLSSSNDFLGHGSTKPNTSAELLIPIVIL